MAHMKKKGYLVVSLDFELFWGMFDKVTLAEYGQNIIGERTAIPRMLALFKKYNIHATWAGVGMLMARTKEELLSLLPPVDLQPTYENMEVSAYHYLKNAHIGTDENEDQYHFGPTLVDMILKAEHQEFGNHTFSHYYCIDGHENPISFFEADLKAQHAISRTYGIVPESIIFPRNQMSIEALRACTALGIRAYRGNENHFFYKPRKDTEQSLFVRGLRLLDHYVNISGHHTYPLPAPEQGLPLNIPASRFLRPWNRTLRFFESLRLRRIKNALAHAAKHGEIFHLWWHPHNFGINQEENFKNLEEILKHFVSLQEKYGMESASMKDITTVVSG